ncbi:hypothetical protein A2U01_0073793, partial [Trifolium medium]|nr:hypothetical protein [Trifolium medium]
MFVAAFQNGLKAGQFNESLTQKPVESMQEVMKRAECYIRGEENNAEKKISRRERAGPRLEGWQGPGAAPTGWRLYKEKSCRGRGTSPTSDITTVRL